MCNIDSFNIIFRFLDGRRVEERHGYLANEGSEKAIAITKYELSQIYYSYGLPNLDNSKRYALSDCEQS